MKALCKAILFVFLLLAIVSCSSSNISSISYTQKPKHKYQTSNSKYKIYKRISSNEQKYMKRFVKIYAKNNKLDPEIDATSPMFSNKSN